MKLSMMPWDEEEESFEESCMPSFVGEIVNNEEDLLPPLEKLLPHDNDAMGILGTAMSQVAEGGRTAENAAAWLKLQHAMEYLWTWHAVYFGVRPKRKLN